jgi:uncharacterized membrane protein YeaQ/YmgE (transglycosylase-associated protein family)
MDLTSILIFLAIGAVAGWLAGTLMKGGSFGLLGNIVVGIIGSVVGGYLFGVLGLSAGGMIGSIFTATLGAVVLLFVVGLVKKKPEVVPAIHQRRGKQRTLNTSSTIVRDYRHRACRGGAMTDDILLGRIQDAVFGVRSGVSGKRGGIRWVLPLRGFLAIALIAAGLVHAEDREAGGW